MNNDLQRQEIVITDVRMPFWSMIRFMVKWAIASIPALIILILLGVLFWGVAIGLFASLGNIARHPPASQVSSTKVVTTVKKKQTSADETAYINKVIVRNVTVGKSVLGEPGVFGEVKNTGDRTLKEVEITIFCLGADGKPVFEKSYHPVLVSEFGFSDENKPFKPGYSRQFGVKLDDAPSDWTKKVDVKVSKIEFQ